MLASSLYEFVHMDLARSLFLNSRARQLDAFQNLIQIERRRFIVSGFRKRLGVV
jgi:hypothetical protein